MLKFTALLGPEEVVKTGVEMSTLWKLLGPFYDEQQRGAYNRIQMNALMELP